MLWQTKSFCRKTFFGTKAFVEILAKVKVYNIQCSSLIHRSSHFIINCYSEIQGL